VTDTNLKWLFDPNASQWAIISGYTWRAIPFIMVICLAALQGIPREFLESSEIDGAGFLQRQRYIVLPLMQNILMVAALLQAVRFFQEMTMVFVLTQGGPVNATMVLSLYTYKIAFEDWDFGLVLRADAFGLGVAITRAALASARADPRIPFVTFLLPPSRRNLGALARLGSRFVGVVYHAGAAFRKYRLDTD